MSERLGAPPSAISGRAGPGTRAPVRVGAPPGGRSLESFSPKVASAKPKTPSFEFVRPLNITKVPNRIPESSPVQAPTFKPLTPEIKTQIKATQNEIPKAFKDAFKENTPKPKVNDSPQSERGSQRFSALGQTQEYRINRSVDPLDRAIAKSEVVKMQKIAESQPQQKANVEIPQAFQRAFTNSPEGSLDPTKPKVPEAFQKAFANSPEGALDPTNISVPKAFYDAFPDGKILDPSIPKALPAEISTIRPIEVPQVDVPPISDVVMNQTPEVVKEIAKRNALPKGSQRFKKSPEVIAKLQAQKNKAIVKSVNITPITEAIVMVGNNSEPKTTEAKIEFEVSKIPTETKRQLVTQLLKDQNLSLPEAVLKEMGNSNNPNVTRRDLVRRLISNNTLSLNEALAQTQPGVQKNKENGQPSTKAELLKGMLTTNNSGLIDTFTKVSDTITVKPDIDLDQLKKVDLLTDKSPIPLRNIAVLAEAAQQIGNIDINQSKAEKPTVTPALIEQIINKDQVIDLMKARELLRQNDQQAAQIVETPQQAIAVINGEGNEVLKISPIIPELRAKAVQLSETLLNPDQKVIIPAEKRGELIETLTELGKTTEYKENPQLQQAVTVLLKEQTAQIIEEQQVANTVQSMVEAGIEPEVIQAQITPVVEQKQLGLDPEQLNQMIEKALIRIQTQTEQQMIDEEDLDEYELLLRQIRMLYIELDDVAMQHRIETSLKALEQAFEKAYEEGREAITGSEIYALIPKEEPTAEKSELIKMLNIDRNDGSRVEYIETINTEAEFDSPAKAYEFVMNALFANRPGRVRENPNNPLLSQAEIEKIYREKSYPSAKIVTFPQTPYLLGSISSSTLTAA